MSDGELREDFLRNVLCAKKGKREKAVQGAKVQGVTIED